MIGVVEQAEVFEVEALDFSTASCYVSMLDVSHPSQVGTSHDCGSEASFGAGVAAGHEPCTQDKGAHQGPAAPAL